MLRVARYSAECAAVGAWAEIEQQSQPEASSGSCVKRQVAELVMVVRDEMLGIVVRYVVYIIV